jgi:hypothetical protein
MHFQFWIIDGWEILDIIENNHVFDGFWDAKGAQGLLLGFKGLNGSFMLVLRWVNILITCFNFNTHKWMHTTLLFPHNQFASRCRFRSGVPPKITPWVAEV